MSLTYATIDAIWRIESPRLIAGLTRVVRDVGLAEDLAQDALVAALEKWPETGVPDNPGAWLMTTAKNRAINEIHRRKRAQRKHEEIGRDVSDEERRDPAPAIEETIDDGTQWAVFEKVESQSHRVWLVRL